MNWFLANAVGGAKLQVEQSDAERAQQLVERIRKQRLKEATGPPKPAVEFPCEECGKPLSFPGHRRGGVETCPFCNEYIDVPE